VVRSRSGVTAIEYGLIAASIAVAFLAIMVLLGGDMANMFSSVSEAVGNANGS
jgi:Flp pilus assembly pilin Flp